MPIRFGALPSAAVERLRHGAAELLADAEIAFVHVRSARDNRSQCRIERAPA